MLSEGFLQLFEFLLVRLRQVVHFAQVRFQLVLFGLLTAGFQLAFVLVAETGQLGLKFVGLVGKVLALSFLVLLF